ncbi:hypothetical protein FA95DRAFT_1580160 [Auriscalpium vulgare]|uniref:Uncharacterized protein n=1 Tax=Auriscalpium vulgare TaxID=40419 RepID=A0ACB8S825_9AGAM|nr:hypothetical protein FA95DRAFT_1580160 [Auriscalpium vulgare]
MASATPASLPSSERAAELTASLADIRTRVAHASTAAPTLVAVSKYKPAADILACHQAGQRDFGENYVQELVDKVPQLPEDIRWHFIGTLQSNKAKTLAAIPNLYAIQTLTSTKAADALNKNLPSTRSTPLHVLLQVNTSNEDAKSGLPPLSTASAAPDDHALLSLARHVVHRCPRLHLQGLMTIGALAESLGAGDENRDFEILKQTRDALEAELKAGEGVWGEGEGRRLVLSMGMSSDFESALRAGADIVRVGTGIFGSRHLKGEAVAGAS